MKMFIDLKEVYDSIPRDVVWIEDLVHQKWLSSYSNPSTLIRKETTVQEFPYLESVISSVDAYIVGRIAKAFSALRNAVTLKLET